MAVMDAFGDIRSDGREGIPSAAYDEDAIVQLITELYITLLRLGPTKDADVAWPPEGHQLDLSEIPVHASIDPRVLSLMKHLPIETSEGNRVAPGMRPVNFLDPYELYMSRKIDMRNYDQDLEDDDIIPAPPTTLMLLRGDNEIDPILVLDIADNTIRRIGDVESLEDAYTRKENDSKKLAQYCYNFYNWPAMPAPVYLQQILQNYLDTTWVPSRAGLISFLDPEGEEEMIERSRLLKKEYEWPDNFRELAWKQEVQKIPDVGIEY